MTFKNKIVEDSDIERLSLPWAKGSHRFWTRDDKRRYSFWGGAVGNPAIGEDFRWLFTLLLEPKNEKYDIELIRGEGSVRLSDNPFVIRWKSVSFLNLASATDLDGLHAVIKDALLAYGEDGKENRLTPNRIIEFDF